VCACQPVVFIISANVISANVAPFARFSIAMISAFLLVRSVGLAAASLAWPPFFAGLAFLALRAPLRLRRFGRGRAAALAIDCVFAH
jgi:hypothetical protein